jgi:hypothetical protein
MRIALLVVLAFASLWFVALRPKPPVDVPPPAPASNAAPKTGEGITSAPGKADRAVAEANGSAAAKESATGKPAAARSAAAAKPAAPAKPAPAAEAKRTGDEQPAAVKRVLGDLDAKRTTVLLFWDRRVSDDREVRRAVSAIDRHDGKVRVHVAPISKVGEFEPITSGVPVVISPTVLVIGGRDRKARAVQGLTVTRELDELVTKALAGR